MMAAYYSTAEKERQEYISWLADRVELYIGNGYEQLLLILFEIPFLFSNEDDRNRAVDGRILRTIYSQSHRVKYEDLVFPFDDGCTFLEFLIGMAGRANDIMYEPGKDLTGDFFMEMITNAGLDYCTDDTMGYTWDRFYVSECVGRILSKRCDFNGNGGLFPLENSAEDQKNVSFWYQLNAYLNEKK